MGSYVELPTGHKSERVFTFAVPGTDGLRRNGPGTDVLKTEKLILIGLELMGYLIMGLELMGLELTQWELMDIKLIN